MIYTFYSYKGGVGRSMAMANVGRWMAMQGLRVMLVDWDLEAPGIESFFFDGDRLDSVRSSPGLIDMVLDYRERYPHIQRAADEVGATQAMDDALVPVSAHTVAVERHGPGTLALVPAGFRAEGRFQDYATAVQRFDWQDFYTSFDGGAYFEWLRNQLLAEADVVLIDSRTGVTEMGGVCTRQLANVVVSFSAANYQNLDGVVRMMRSFVRPDVQKFRDQVRGDESDGAPLMVAVPARIDQQAETDRQNWFRAEFREKMGEFVPKAFRAAGNGFWELQLPYIAKYAFREKLVIGEDDANETLEEAYGRLGERLLALLPEGSAAAARLRKHGRRKHEPVEGENLLDRAVQLEESLDDVEKEMLRWIILRLVIYQGEPLRRLAGRTAEPERFDALLDWLVDERIVLIDDQGAWLGLDQNLMLSWPLVDEVRSEEPDLLRFLDRLRSAMALDQPMRGSAWAASWYWSKHRPEVLVDSEVDFIEVCDVLRRLERPWWPARYPGPLQRPVVRWVVLLFTAVVVAALSVAIPPAGGIGLGVVAGVLLAAWWEWLVAGPATATGAVTSVGVASLEPEPPPFRIRAAWPTAAWRFTYAATFQRPSIAYFEFAQPGRAHPRAAMWDVCVRTDDAELVVEGPASVVRRMVKPFRKDMRFARPKAPD